MNKIIIPGFTCVFWILWYHWKTILGSFIIYAGLSHHLQNVENTCLQFYFLYLPCSLQIKRFPLWKWNVWFWLVFLWMWIYANVKFSSLIIKKKKCWRCWFSPILSVFNIRTTSLKRIFSFLFFFREWHCGFSQTRFIPNLTCVKILFSCFIQDRQWGNKFVVKEASLAFPGVKILISRGQLACF